MWRGERWNGSARCARDLKLALRPPLGVLLHGAQHEPSDDRDSGRDEGPVVPEAAARALVGTDRARFRHKPCGSVRQRVGAKRPRNLDVTGLVERGKDIRGERLEVDVGFPGTADRAEHNLAARHLVENAPADSQHLCEQAARRPLGAFGAEYQPAGLENGARDNRLPKIHLTRRRIHDGCRRMDAHVVALDDVIPGKEPIQQRIGKPRRGGWRMAVPQPRYRDQRGVPHRHDRPRTKKPPHTQRKPYATCTSIAFGFTSGAFGRWMFSTPSLNSAAIRPASTFVGRAIRRTNLP